MGTDKKANFIRLAESRTNKVIDGIRLLGNLSNTSYYEYTPDQIEAIFNAIEEELALQKERFNRAEVKVKKFRL